MKRGDVVLVNWLYSVFIAPDASPWTNKRPLNPIRITGDSAAAVAASLTFADPNPRASFSSSSRADRPIRLQDVEWPASKLHSLGRQRDGFQCL